MLRNMVTSLLEYESIVTTDARAKALRSLADKMITLGKRGDLHARRQALRVIRSKRVAKRLFDEIAPRYADRDGGYVRVLKKGTARSRLSVSSHRTGKNNIPRGGPFAAGGFGPSSGTRPCGIKECACNLQF